jgi:uncharacterized protein
MRILCLSDIHGEAAGLSDIVPPSSECDLVLVAGDLTHLGGAAEAAAILEPLLAHGIPLYAIAGNIDREGVREHLGSRGIDLHGRGVILGDVGIMGLGGGTPSPFGTPWELPDEEAALRLEEGFRHIEGARLKVLLSHAPPRNTRLDRSLARMHVGSQPVRDFLARHPVDLCLCGHIHEARGEERVGRTLCVNIGPYKSGHYALLTLTEGGATVTWRKR